MKKYLFLFAIIFITVSNINIYSQTGRVETFYVKDSQVSCEAVVPQKCLQVRRGNQNEFGLFYDRIENFDFIAGYEYELRVAVIKLDVTPKDTSGYKYLLKEIVSRKPAEPVRNFSAELVNRNWRLRFLNGKEIKSDMPFLRFEYDGNRFSGSTGCNSIGGEYEIDGDAIKFSKVISTKKACLDPDNPESAFLENFAKVDRFEVSEDRLELSAGGVVVMSFVPRDR